MSLSAQVDQVSSSLESLRRMVLVERITRNKTKNPNESCIEELGSLTSNPEMSLFYSRVKKIRGETHKQLGFYKFLCGLNEYFLACPLNSTENWLKKLILYLFIDFAEAENQKSTKEPVQEESDLNGSTNSPKREQIRKNNQYGRSGLEKVRSEKGELGSKEQDYKITSDDPFEKKKGSRKEEDALKNESFVFIVEFFRPKSDTRVPFSVLRSFESYEVKITRSGPLIGVAFPSNEEISEIILGEDVHCVPCFMAQRLRKIEELERTNESLRKLEMAFSRKKQKFYEEKNKLEEKMANHERKIGEFSEKIKEMMKESLLFDLEKAMEKLEEGVKKEVQKLRGQF